MAEFHETGYGKRFFDGQLPKLLQSLDKLIEILDVDLRADYNGEEVMIVDFKQGKGIGEYDHPMLAIFAHENGRLDVAPVSLLKVHWR